MKLLTILSLVAPAIAFAGNEGPGPHPMPVDACGAPYKISYVTFVSEAGARNCGEEMSRFTTTNGEGGISNINGLKDANLLYAVLVRDPATGNTVSATVKCDAATGKASLLTLQFAARGSYGGCAL